MIKKPQSIWGQLAVFSLCFLVLAGIFYWIVADDWSRTSLTTDAVAPGKTTGAAGDIIEKTFLSPVDVLEEIGK